MEDMDDDRFEPLFIKEDDRDPDRTMVEPSERNAAQSGLGFTGLQLHPSASIRPYLQEMDDLLKSCEELTGLPFSSHFSESHGETSTSGRKHLQDTDEVTMESHTGMSVSPKVCPSTSYIDTRMDGAGTDGQPEQCRSQCVGTVISRSSAGVAPIVPHQTEMPLTSAGKKLSETMVEYEGQLLGMLAMLDSSMEETSMDFEPQDWATDTSQEYVHICKNPQVCRATTLAPTEQERPENQDAQPMQLESWAALHADDDTVSEDSGHEKPQFSVTKGGHPNPVLGCDTISGFFVKRSDNFRTNQEDLERQCRFYGPSKSIDNEDNDPMCCEGTETEYMYNEDTEAKVDISGNEMPARQDTRFRSGVDELQGLGSQMEAFIEQVQLLQKRRKELLAEVLELRGGKVREDTEGNNEEAGETEEGINGKVAELMNILMKEEEARRQERKREIQNLKEERAEEERRMWKVNLERQGLQDELRKLKRRLFTVARDCAQNQATLHSQYRAVELLKTEEEQLQSLVLQLTDESCHIRTTQQKLLLELQVQLHSHSSSQMSNTQEELSECRRHSCGDIQQYVQGGLRALENRYEPILLALLKRREAAAGALVKAKEQAQELKAQLGPLVEEIQKLKLQKACLEEKLKLMYIHWREDVGRYKETVCCLEERCKELKTELKFQKRKTKETEGLRDSLTKQLLLYRAAIEEHNQHDHEETT